MNNQELPNEDSFLKPPQSNDHAETYGTISFNKDYTLSKTSFNTKSFKSVNDSLFTHQYNQDDLNIENKQFPNQFVQYKQSNYEQKSPLSSITNLVDIPQLNKLKDLQVQDQSLQSYLHSRQNSSEFEILLKENYVFDQSSLNIQTEKEFSSTTQQEVKKQNSQNKIQGETLMEINSNIEDQTNYFNSQLDQITKDNALSEDPISLKYKIMLDLKDHQTKECQSQIISLESRVIQLSSQISSYQEMQEKILDKYKIQIDINKQNQEMNEQLQRENDMIKKECDNYIQQVHQQQKHIEELNIMLNNFSNKEQNLKQNYQHQTKEQLKLQQLLEEKDKIIKVSQSTQFKQEQKIDILENERNSLQFKIIKLEEECNELKNHIQQIELELAASRTQKDLRAKMQNLTQQFQSSLEQAQIQKNKDIHAYENLLNECQNKIGSLSDEKNALQKKNQEINEQNDKLVKMLELCQHQILELEHNQELNFSFMETKLHCLMTQYKEIQNEKQIALAQNLELKEKIESLQIEITKLQKIQVKYLQNLRSQSNSIHLEEPIIEQSAREFISLKKVNQPGREPLQLSPFSKKDNRNKSPLVSQKDSIASVQNNSSIQISNNSFMQLYISKKNAEDSLNLSHSLIGKLLKTQN